MASRAKKQKEETFEESIEQLEQILKDLEFGAIPLAELVDKYTKAKEYIKICQKQLDDAELKISLIDSDGSSEIFNLENNPL